MKKVVYTHIHSIKVFHRMLFYAIQEIMMKYVKFYELKCAVKAVEAH
jgi:hypothetical protein